MAGIEDYSTVAGSNTSINGINVNEGMPPSNVNDAFRQMMADVRREFAVTSLTSSVTISIGEALGGKIHIINDAGKSISAFDTIAAGITRELVFDVGAILVHDATKMILPGAANLTISAGDSVKFLSEGSGNWRLTSYIKAASQFSTRAGSETLTNKTIDCDSNTVTNVGQDEISASAVGQGELKTTTASGSQNISAGSNDTITLTGGTYSWWTLSNVPTGGDPNLVFGGGSDTAAGVIGLYNAAGNTAQVHRDERYIQASPPYNLGHGDIPLFVFVLFDGSAIVGIDVAPDPTWAYHGPTDIRPQRIDRATGKKYRSYREVAGVPFKQAIRDATVMRRVMAGDIPVSLVEREITHEIKNRDMNLWPHPWSLNDMTGKTVVLLEPTAPLMDRLAMLQAEAGAREVLQIIEPYLSIDNTPLAYTTPSGVIACRASWKS